MFLLIEADRKYAGFGIEWMRYTKGVRLGFIAIHIITGHSFEEFLELHNKKYHSERLNELNKEISEDTHLLNQSLHAVDSKAVH